MSKDKLILVHYISVGNISYKDVEGHLLKIRDQMSSPKDEHISYFIPVRDSDSRVECINPKLLDKDEYKIHLKRLKKAEKEFYKVIESMNESKFTKKVNKKITTYTLKENPHKKWWEIPKRLKWNKEVLKEQLDIVNKYKNK
jgi:hypothetical protein